jgi:PAS domain S-box-containing protein
MWDENQMDLLVRSSRIGALRRGLRSFVGRHPSAEEVDFLRTMFDEAPAGIAQVSPDGRFLRVNRKYCEIVGHTAAELRSLRFLDITHADDFAIGVRERSRLGAGEIDGYSVEKRYVRADGTTVWAEVEVSAVRRPTGEIEHLLAVVHDIGERRAHQAAIRDSEQLHRAILDAALDAIITIDHRGTILEWNSAAERMFGYAAADAIGREMASLVVPPQLRAQHRSGLARHLATGKERIIGRRIQLPAERADGTRFPAEVSITRVRTAEPPVFTGHVRDLTDQERTHQALRESEERLRAVVEASPDDTFQLKSPEGRWLMANPATLRLFGLENVDYRGKTDFELASEAGPASSAALLACADSDEAVWRLGVEMRFEEVVPVSEVESRTFHVVKVPMFHEDGSRQGLVSLARDITTEKQAEVQRLRFLEEAIVGRDEFLSIASHELRTPATSLLLAAEALARLADRGALGQTPLALRLVHTCQRQSLQLQRLIDRLLDVGRIRTGGLHLDLEVFDLGALLRELISSMEGQLAQAGCETRLRIDATVIGRWDHSRLQEVFGNLISNASKYGAGEPIEVTVGETNGIARVTVRDRGIGIAKEQQRTIFGKFERGAAVGSYGGRSPRGLGLGLYIAREIVQAHSGKIYVESEPGAGSTFTVELPIGGMEP